MKNLINRIQRELPDTDKNRYDAAYERGKAQATSGPLLGGLAFGAVVGAGLMFLFDPDRGAARRSQLVSRASGVRNDMARTAGDRLEDLQNRARDTNGTSHAGRPAESDAPGANVPDPIKPEEVERYGASGPIAGATLSTEPAKPSDSGRPSDSAKPFEPRPFKAFEDSQPADADPATVTEPTQADAEPGDLEVQAPRRSVGG